MPTQSPGLLAVGQTPNLPCSSHRSAVQGRESHCTGWTPGYRVCPISSLSSLQGPEKSKVSFSLVLGAKLQCKYRNYSVFREITTYYFIIQLIMTGLPRDCHGFCTDTVEQCAVHNNFILLLAATGPARAKLEYGVQITIRLCLCFGLRNVNHPVCID